MANVQYFRPTPQGRTDNSGLSRGRGRYLVLGLVVVIVAVIAGVAVIVATGQASLSPGATAMADVSLPLGGGTIKSVDAVTGPHSQPVPVRVSGDQIWPRHAVPAGERLTVDVVVKRPGWISWLSGATQTAHLTLVAPVASLRSQYLTVRGQAPLRLRFRTPVAAYAAGAAGHLQHHTLASPASVIRVPRTGEAGTLFVSATPRTWEKTRPVLVSWFPAGHAATAVANPAPGSTIGASTPITLTFSKPISSALGSHLPPVSPASSGSWHQLNSHAMVFKPSGYGYGLGAKVQVALPSGVHLVGGSQGKDSSAASWTVPGGSTLRLQQMLALLNYLPLKFHYAGAGVGLSPQDQLQAAVKPPAGHFTWRYSDTPSALRSFWSPGASGVMTQGALMAFENDHGLVTDGQPGPLLWRTLISAVLKRQRSTFGYTFVQVSEATERLNLWHNGRTVIAATPVNTGIASAPTATGTYPVFEHVPVTTMSGTNPDGSHYSDPGIQWVSYFNGGDALHGFTRAQYGFPQSLGCVEMPVGVAGQVYPYTPIGTLVHVA